MKYVRDVRTVDSQTAVVVCRGGLGSMAVEELRQAVNPLLEGSVFHLVFDLTRVEYVGSRAFELLEAAQDQGKKRRGKEWSANARRARPARKKEPIRATGVRFTDNVLWVSLSDGREIGVSVDRVEWLGWLAKATPRQRARWFIEPEGLAIYWEDLDDGLEVCHLLEMQPLA